MAIVFFFSSYRRNIYHLTFIPDQTASSSGLNKSVHIHPLILTLKMVGLSKPSILARYIFAR